MEFILHVVIYMNKKTQAQCNYVINTTQPLRVRLHIE